MVETMMMIDNRRLLAASLVLALVLTFSCGEVDNGGNEPNSSSATGISSSISIDGGSSSSFFGQKCGGLEYDIEKLFCSDNIVYSKCNGLDYDPLKYRCQSNVLENRCGTGNSFYNSATQFCSGNTVYSKCNDLEYDPVTQRCSNNVILNKCENGSSYYNPATQFCSGTTVYPKCNDLEYDTMKHRCQNNVLETKCGNASSYYNPATQFCSANTVYSKCDGLEYDPATHGCQNSVILPKCESGTNLHDPATQFCRENNVYPKCEGQEYSATDYCSNGTLKEYGSVVDSDGKAYKTVEIGTQVWMAENLNYNVAGSKCYDGLGSNCTKYGRLYDWATAMGIDAKYNDELWSGSNVKHRGICPTGWHLPSDAEWTQLTDFIGETAGTKLKTVNGWNNSSGIPGTNEFGFSALPGGSGYSSSAGGYFSHVGNEGLWWTSSRVFANTAYCRGIGYSNDYVERSHSPKLNYYSVRCVRD